MLRQVIFDFGQVLVHFKKEYMIAPYVKDAKDVELLWEVLFDRLYWDALDAGTITDEQVMVAACQRLPARLHEVARTVYENWIYNLPEIDGMRALIRRIKERYGVRVFVISNISRYFAAHADEIPVLAEAEGCVFSAVCGFVKPSAEIFAHLCHTYSLRPEECLFVDDSEKNVRGAEAFGIRGYLFDGDATALSTYLDEVLSV